MSTTRCPPRTRSASLAWGAPALAAALALAGCGNDDVPAARGRAKAGAIPYDTLSEYGFFQGDMALHDPVPGVVPYDVAAALWADHAGKKRFIVLPEGETAAWDPGEEWALPRGSIIIKAFDFPRDRRDPGAGARVIETRLLILEDEGWTSHTYVWDDAQTEARRVIAGKDLTVSYIDEQGAAVDQRYLVPNTNQCKGCHERDDTSRLLGLTTPQVNRKVVRDGQEVEQLDWLAAQGVFASAPPSATAARFEDPFGDGPLDARARAYLAANCSHCHRPGGGGGDSGLVLLESERTPAKNGVCKSPAAAGSGTGGRTHDIVPGSPDQSIIIFRMSSTDPEIKMPELPNLLPDARGITLISEWITAMEPKGCP